MIHEADVVVAGAGPAGSTAATLLARQGYRVILLDRATFPRHKTCASWINRLAFERFPYLSRRIDDLVESPFFGVRFYDSFLNRSADFMEATPSGYLSLRTKFDDGLRRLAIEEGAEFHGASAVVNVRHENDEVHALTARGDEFRGRVLIGADGASSRVAMAAGLRRGWSRQDYVICANADVPYAPERIEEFFGKRFPFRVYLQYRMIQGYGWVFPKRKHICAGLGGLLIDNRRIRPLFARFLGELLERGHLPADFRAEEVHYDVDPVGAVHRLPSLTRGRVMLIGDAAGFVSGSTGEGIYPAMMSAQVASQVIHGAFCSSSVEPALAGFNTAWRRELADYVRRLPGGEKESVTQRRIGLIFRSPFLARVAGRIFLYGEQPSLRTFIHCIRPCPDPS